MKKQILITAAGVIGASILSFLYYAFVYYPALIESKSTYWIQLGYYALRLVLCVGFCWWLASYVNRGRELNRHGAFLRFLRSSWIALAGLVVMFFLFNIDGPVRDVIGGGRVGYAIWDFFVNSGIDSWDAYTNYGMVFSPIPLFLVETFLTQSFYYFWLVGFLVYRYRRARYMPSMKTIRVPVDA